jgi:hypothetical protein
MCHLQMAQGEVQMAEPQLSVRSARARDLAHMLAKRERRTVAQVVEKALEAYAQKPTDTRESTREFLDRLLKLDANDTVDIDLEAVIREGRKPHSGIDLE